LAQQPPAGINRRSFLSLAAAGAHLPRGQSSLLLIPAGERQRIGAHLLKQRGLAAAARKLAGKALEAGPWSVVYHRPNRPGAAPNDYYSDAPYWWPDPKNPGGPFIRKDGERYPDRFQANRRDLGLLCDTLLSLGIGACLLGDARCAAHASRLLSVWFIDARTRMNPHLEYGQGLPGRSDGRGAGIIETVGLIDAAQGIALLETGGKLEAGVADGVRRWYAEYLRWMTSSAKGRDEQKASNNHATWWTAQVAAFGALLADQQAKSLAWEQYRTHLLPKQVQPDGSCPAEEARTRSLSYSSMNLDGFAVLCRLAELEGVDLWRYKSPAGIGLERAFRYLLPFVEDPARWRKQQITAYDQDRVIFPALAGLGLKEPAFLDLHRKLPRAAAPRVLLVDLLASAG
jgi:hypothetical protein